jgi:hypothetical protein
LGTPADTDAFKRKTMLIPSRRYQHKPAQPPLIPPEKRQLVFTTRGASKACNVPVDEVGEWIAGGCPVQFPASGQSMAWLDLFAVRAWLQSAYPQRVRPSWPS